MSQIEPQNKLFKAAIEASTLSRDEVSKVANIDRKTIYNLINHPKQQVHQRVQDSLARILGKTPAELGWFND